MAVAGAGAGACQNIFLQPLAWMKGIEDDVHVVEGKLCCPRCDVKVGAFNWSGCQCSCGAWVTPAFYVQLGKVDVMQFPHGGGGGGSGSDGGRRGGGGGGGGGDGGGASGVGGIAVRMPRRFAASSRPPVQRPSASK